MDNRHFMKPFRNYFLMRKMTEIGTGLFYHFNEGYMKIPTSIIQIHQSDREGNLYFEMPRPFRDMGGIEKSFFSKILFFNRSCNMHVIAGGYATILDNHEESENIFIQFHLSEACGILHRKKEWNHLFGWVQHMSALLSKDYNREPDWVALPA